MFKLTIFLFKLDTDFYYISQLSFAIALSAVNREFDPQLWKTKDC